MSKSPDSLREEFIANKDDKSYRHAYADESLNIAIATQLKVLREQREWRQEDLAIKAEMTQPMVSRYENVNYSSWSINTLKKFALAYDVWLDVRFRSFGELVTTTEEFSRESLQVPAFDGDPFFKEVPAIAVKKVTLEVPVTAPVQAFDLVPPQNISGGIYAELFALGKWFNNVPVHPAVDSALGAIDFFSSMSANSLSLEGGLDNGIHDQSTAIIPPAANTALADAA
jgi:transcriptional regulator with XRE-family HTH domain